MANTLLTPQMILRESYAIMHQQGNALMRVNRQYDDRFANRELKIGQSLDVRLPPKFVTRDGNTMSAQNVVDRAVELPCATIKGIDFNLSQEDLTFSIEDVSDRILKPALSQLTATVEHDFLSTVYKKVSNYVGIVTTASTTAYRDFQNAGRYLTDNLAPKPDRTAILDTQTTVDFSDAVKGLFQSADNIREQYVEGVVGRTGGFAVFENTNAPTHTTGAHTGNITVTTSSASDMGFDGTGNNWPTQTYFELKVDTANPMTFKAGDIVTIADVYDVHPETKQKYGYLKRFVVQEDQSGSGGGTIAVKIAPVPVLSGAYQNVSGPIQDGKGVTRLGPAGGASAITYGQSLLFHRDAFAFVTADLEDPSKYGAWGGREVLDGLSIRIWRAGDIVNGKFPCRLDIAYGFAAIYPEWAVRWVHAQE